MALDATTLTVAGSFVTALTAAVLGFTWTQFRDGSVALWWAASNLFLSLGIGILAVVWSGGADAAIMPLGFLAMTVSPALAWTGIRAFNQRRPHLPLLLAGPLLIALAPLAAPPSLRAEIGAAINLLVTAAYLGAASWEILRPVEERLRSSRALGIVVGAHALFILACVRDTFAIDLGRPAPFGTILGAIHFEMLVYAIASSVFVVALVRERSEAIHQKAARIDPLTGIPNRRAFATRAEFLIERAVREGAPVSLLMLDLDRFKLVNDTHGHDFGDRVLQAFADSARRVLRPNDLLSRWGGEEFVVLLPGAGREAALCIAERMRLAFLTAGEAVGGTVVHATVSIGIASDQAAASTLDELMKRADTALYKAKRLGRNRVEAEPAECLEGGAVIRIA